MNVIGVGRGQTPRTSPSRASAATAFAVAPQAERVPGFSPVSRAAPLDMVLALQEQETDVVRDRRARQHGHALLRGLAAVQHSLLGGGDEVSSLQQLAALTVGYPEAADPGLAAIIQALALRAQIELARRGL